MTQLSTPYPATAYWTGFLRQHAAALDLALAQADASIEQEVQLADVISELMRSRGGLDRWTAVADAYLDALSSAPRPVNILGSAILPPCAQEIAREREREASPPD